MGKKDTTPRGRVIAAFKGFMRSYRLEPQMGQRLRENQDYRCPIGMPLFHRGEEAFAVFYCRKANFRLLDLVERLYPDQVDRKVVQRYLDQIVTEWIEQGTDSDDQSQLEQAAIDFLDEIEHQFGDFVIYVPIDGLEGDWPSQGLELGGCQLHRNSQHSELVKLLQVHRKQYQEPDEYLSSAERASAFFKIRVSAHSDRAVQEAKAKARLALDILRLFNGSYYFDVYQRPSIPKRMGLIGTLPEGERSPVLMVRDSIPIEKQIPGSSVQFGRYWPFKLDHKTVDAMNNIGLARINRLVREAAMGNKGSVGPRLLRCVSWFAKATTAHSIADSLMMYAISLGSLLSEGNTPKETYAKRMAALVTREGEDGYCPLGGWHMSAGFHERLEGRSQNDLFSEVKSRVVELFGLRNDVVHGRVLGYEIDPLGLLDFETLVRCSILSFVHGEWDTLKQFKSWVERSYPQSHRWSVCWRRRRS